MLYTKEWYETMEAFEKAAPKLIRTGSQGFKREEKENWPKGYYYTDGNVNDCFKVYLSGYMHGRVVYMNN